MVWRTEITSPLLPVHHHWLTAIDANKLERKTLVTILTYEAHTGCLGLSMRAILWPQKLPVSSLYSWMWQEATTNPNTNIIRGTAFYCGTISKCHGLKSCNWYFTYASSYSFNNNCGPSNMGSNVLISADRSTGELGCLKEKGSGVPCCVTEENPLIICQNCSSPTATNTQQNPCRCNI